MCRDAICVPYGVLLTWASRVKRLQGRMWLDRPDGTRGLVVKTVELVCSRGTSTMDTLAVLFQVREMAFFPPILRELVATWHWHQGTQRGFGTT